jgi:hypothetical protein
MNRPGEGVYPTHDPWGTPFSISYEKQRWKLGGQRIAGRYVGCLEGIQGDQDYIRTMMTPARAWDGDSIFCWYSHPKTYINYVDYHP